MVILGGSGYDEEIKQSPHTDYCNVPHGLKNGVANRSNTVSQ